MNVESFIECRNPQVPDAFRRNARRVSGLHEPACLGLPIRFACSGYQNCSVSVAGDAFRFWTVPGQDHGHGGHCPMPVMLADVYTAS